jgi:hypothetical protein
MAVNDLITFRKGIASEWISANPVLASGEPGYDLTNSVLKIGDGVSNWVALSGIGSTSVVSYTTTSSFPASGVSNTYYLASDTSRLYQWTGSYYAEIGPPTAGVNNAQNAANLYLWNNFK